MQHLQAIFTRFASHNLHTSILKGLKIQDSKEHLIKVITNIQAEFLEITIMIKIKTQWGE